MRSEQVINNELEAQLAEYRANAQVWNQEQISESNAVVKKLREELSAAISTGANECPNCATPPFGMRRGEAIAGSSRFPVYEVGCLVCEPVVTEKNGKAVRISYSAQGASPQQAVENWNDNLFIEDGKIS